MPILHLYFPRADRLSLCRARGRTAHFAENAATLGFLARGRRQLCSAHAVVRALRRVWIHAVWRADQDADSRQFGMRTHLRTPISLCIIDLLFFDLLIVSVAPFTMRARLN